MFIEPGVFFTNVSSISGDDLYLVLNTISSNTSIGISNMRLKMKATTIDSPKSLMKERY